MTTRLVERNRGRKHTTSRAAQTPTNKHRRSPTDARDVRRPRSDSRRAVAKRASHRRATTSPSPPPPPPPPPPPSHQFIAVLVAAGGVRRGAPSRPLLTMRAGRRRSLRGQEHSHRNGWRADGACRSRFAVARAPASSRVERRAPGAELGITSDGFFELTELPPRTIVVGAGYIAVELAGILQVVSSSIERVGGF